MKFITSIANKLGFYTKEQVKGLETQVKRYTDYANDLEEFINKGKIENKPIIVHGNHNYLSYIMLKNQQSIIIAPEASCNTIVGVYQEESK